MIRYELDFRVKDGRLLYVQMRQAQNGAWVPYDSLEKHELFEAAIRLVLAWEDLSRTKCGNVTGEMHDLRNSLDNMFGYREWCPKAEKAPE